MSHYVNYKAIDRLSMTKVLSLVTLALMYTNSQMTIVDVIRLIATFPSLRRFPPCVVSCWTLSPADLCYFELQLISEQSVRISYVSTLF